MPQSGAAPCSPTRSCSRTGLPPVVANGTNTRGAGPRQPVRQPGATGASWPGARREVVPLAVAGGVRAPSLGAVLVVALPASVFERIVPWFILAACVLVAGAVRASRRPARHAASTPTTLPRAPCCPLLGGRASTPATSARPRAMILIAALTTFYRRRPAALERREERAAGRVQRRRGRGVRRRRRRWPGHAAVAIAAGAIGRAALVGAPVRPPASRRRRCAALIVVVGVVAAVASFREPVRWPTSSRSTDPADPRLARLHRPHRRRAAPGARAGRGPLPRRGREGRSGARSTAGYEPRSLLMAASGGRRSSRRGRRARLPGVRGRRRAARDGDRLPRAPRRARVDAASPAADAWTTCSSRRARVVVLEDLVDHTNVGAVFRNAAALGIDAVLVSPECADPLYRRSVKVSMGSVFAVPWTRAEPWPDALRPAARRSGFRVLAMSPDPAADLRCRIDVPDGGSRSCSAPRGTGSPTQRSRAVRRHRVRIPMAAGVDSLNVAAASAVVFYAVGSSRAAGSVRRSGRRCRTSLPRCDDLARTTSAKSAQQVVEHVRVRGRHHHVQARPGRRRCP